MEPGPDEALTLQDAAARLGVHYMTAYRYVRTGRLPAERVGGQWRVRLRDLAAVAAAGSTGRRPRRGGANWGRYRERVLDRMLAGDEPGAWAVVEGAVGSGADAVAVHLDVLAPALREVGARWERGELDVADEHRATAVAQRLVARLGPWCSRRGRRRGTVLLGGAPGDLHGLPATIVADVLRCEGYEVVELGANTPEASFVHAARNVDRLLAVGVSVGTGGRDRVVHSTVRALRRAIPGVPVLVGGPAVDGADHAELLGADGWAGDARGVAALVAGFSTTRA